MADEDPEDPWAVFGGDEAVAAASEPPPLAGTPEGAKQPAHTTPRACEHEQLSWTRTFWPSSELSSIDMLDLAIQRLKAVAASTEMTEMTAAFAARRAKPSYGPEVAACLSNFAHHVADLNIKRRRLDASRDVAECSASAAARDSAAKLRDLCIAEKEEHGWRDSHWSIAHLWSLGILLASCLESELFAEGNSQEPHDFHANPAARTGTGIAAAWMKLYEIVVYADGLDFPEDAQNNWLGPLLLATEQVVSAKRKPSTAADLKDGSFHIPVSLPASCVATVPDIDPRRMIPARSHGPEGLSALEFAREYRGTRLRPGTPVLIKGYLETEWDLKELSDLRKLQERHGHRLVPVSLGSLLFDNLKTGIMPLGDLISGSLVPSNATHKDRATGVADSEMSESSPDATNDPDAERVLARTAYMSQHSLFHQCPDLMEHFSVPSYNLGRRLQPPNAWIGTRGTVTTLHSDTSDGFLCQVAGYKYVRLYGPLEAIADAQEQPGDVPCQTDKLYADFYEEANSGKRFGTSPVRIERPDFEEHPLFREAQYTEAIIGPGDMLYIPEGHWHYIRSLTTSVSVNFW
eukprot:TRINITY_DN25940_c0_g1_i1.p1 TRINITY_DN25940_c0_g1~~TRINITY_DN25940_c0_g1_i1.p1  ORF type:complete len:576 (-),score=59.55 TRINITY_DN25940_c0_g1_i1:17-1744(-)